MRFLCLLLALPMLATAADVKTYSYTFEKPNDLILSGDAFVSDGLLHLNGAGQVTIPGSEDMCVTPEGLTMSAVVRLRNRDDGVQGLDIFSKGCEWMLSRDNSGGFYCMFHTDGPKWSKALRGGVPVPPGQWAHYAASFTRIQRQGQGETGYVIKSYINGEVIGNIHVLGHEATNGTALVQFGWGLGKLGWSMRGDVASIKMWKRALSDDEVERDALSSRYVKITLPGKTELTEGFKQKLKTLKGADAGWMRKSLSRAAANGADQEILARGISSGGRGVWKVMESPRAKALFLLRGAGNAFPLAGLYDRKLKREVFGRQTMTWRIKVSDAGGLEDWTDADADCVRSVKDETDGVLAEWRKKGATVRVRLRFSGARVEAKLDVDNGNPSLLLREVKFPMASFARIPGAAGRDRIVIPFMGGVEHFDPVEKQSNVADQDYYFPSSNMNLQMGAYYDDMGGVYYAHEDPTAGLKRISFLGRRGDLDVAYLTTVAYPHGAKGGNSHRQQGVGALELFSGDWYDAAQIYKRFLFSEAPWYVKDLPRLETPEWIRNNAVWFGVGINKDKGFPWEKVREDMLRMRRYFELPIAIHTRDWTKSPKMGGLDFPHFRADPESMARFAELRSQGILLSGYIDDRLWAEKDGPFRKSELMYNPFGFRYRLLRESGENPKERYKAWHYEKGGRGWYVEPYVTSVMCPASRGWQEFLRWTCEDIAAGPRLDQIYHDQVMAAVPFSCFNPDHGHLMNDPQMWYAHGFRPLLEQARAGAAKYNPGTAHASEDGAEPYCKGMLDSCLNWRWTHEMVPLFVSLYAGRFQFWGRILGDSVERNSDPGGIFCKMAEQLVWSEQIGSFYNTNFNEIDDRETMLFAKRMAHLRTALLPYLNESEFLRLPSFETLPPMVGYKWNAYRGGSGGGDRIINTPQVRATHWERQRDKVRMAVFVNSEDSAITVKPILPGMGRALVLVDGAKPRFGTDYSLTLKPRGVAVIIGNCSDAHLDAEAKRLSPVMKRIDGFKPEPEDPSDLALPRPSKGWIAASAAKLKGAYAEKGGSRVGWMSKGAVLDFGDCLVERTNATVEMEMSRCETEEKITLLINGRNVGAAVCPPGGRKTVSIPYKSAPRKGKVRFVFANGGAEAVRWRIVVPAAK